MRKILIRFSCFVFLPGKSLKLRDSRKSNCISRIGSGCQNWRTLSKNDKYEKFSNFAEVYDCNIFDTSELKTELLELRKHWELAQKFEKFMFFGAVRLNIH